MIDLSSMTETQLYSYFAGMLDYAAKLEIKRSGSGSLKMRLHVRSKSRAQILLFQKAFGGEIHQRNKDTYVIRFLTLRFKDIVSKTGPFLETQRERFFGALVRLGDTPPVILDREIEHYITGKTDAKLGRENEIFDSSILSSKDAAFYAAESQRVKEAKATQREQAAQTKLAAALKTKQDKIDAARVKRAAAAKKRDEELLKARLIRWAAQTFEADQKEMLAASSAHDLWWTVAYRESKVCRICKQAKSILDYDRGVVTMDRRKHECKKCSYERYVKPELAKRNQRTKDWAAANPNSVRLHRKKQAAKPHSKMRRTISNRLKHLIGSKSERTVELISCSPKDLVLHLASLFSAGMSWDNYGDWHVDHKIPCRAFDLTKKEERLKCFHWTNLQPLWAKDNLAKQDKMPDGSLARDLISWREGAALP